MEDSDLAFSPSCSAGLAPALELLQFSVCVLSSSAFSLFRRGTTWGSYPQQGGLWFVCFALCGSGEHSSEELGSQVQGRMARWHCCSSITDEH